MKIPFEVVGGIILLDVSAEGKSGRMAFDTGAMQTCLNRKYFPALAGEEKQAAVFDGGMKAEAAVSGKCRLSCHDWVLPETPVVLLDLDYVEKPLRGLRSGLVFLGTLGIDQIRSHTVFLDYAGSRLILDEEAPEGMEAFDLKTEALPVIDVCIGEDRCRFVLDTGANTCMLDESFRQSGLPVLNEGAGLVRIPRLAALGGEYRDVTAVITNMASIKARADVSGVIGYQVLKDCVSFFDFQAGRISIRR